MHVSSSGSLLEFRPEPTKQIIEFFGVGERTSANCVEQGGWLVGFYGEKNPPHCVRAAVTHFLPAHNAKGSPAFLEISGEENCHLGIQFLRLKAEDPRLELLGWIHSHPNDLPVFLSEVDKATIRRDWNKPTQFSVVLNPQTLEWKVFMGVDAIEVYSLAHPEEKVPVMKNQKQKKQPYGRPRGRKKKRKESKKHGRSH